MDNKFSCGRLLKQIHDGLEKQANNDLRTHDLTMRRDISQKIDRLPLKYFDTVSTGDVLSRVTNDVDTVGQSMNQSFSTLVSSLALLLGSTVMMLLTNWLLALTGIFAALLGFAIMMLVIAHSQTYYARQQAELGTINGHVEETIGGHNVVKAYNGEEKEKTSFHEQNDRLYLCAWKSQFLSGLMAAVGQTSVFAVTEKPWGTLEM